MAHVRLTALALVLLVGGGAPAHADHGDPWLVAFPAPGAELPRNGRVILIAQNGPHALVAEPSRFRYRLRGPARTVALRPTETGRGADWDGYGTSYLVLAPARALAVGSAVALEARWDGAWRPVPVAAPLHGPTARYGGPSRLATWRVRRPDGRAPRWSAEPSLDTDAYGATRVTVELEDANPVAFHVVARAPGARALDLVTQHAPVFGVRDGCASVLLEGGRRHVRLTPLDPSGNRGATRAVTVDPADELVLCVAGLAGDY